MLRESEERQREQIRRQRLACQEQHTKKEQELFLAQCSQEDRERIQGQREMTEADYDRLTLQAEKLGYTDYEIELIVGFPDILEQKGREELP